MSRGLATRLARLEKRRRYRRPLRPIIFTVYDQGPSEIVGLAAPGGMVPREPWEPLAALIDRAHASLDTRIMAAVYRP